MTSRNDGMFTENRLRSLKLTCWRWIDVMILSIYLRSWQQHLVKYLSVRSPSLSGWPPDCLRALLAVWPQVPRQQKKKRKRKTRKEKERSSLETQRLDFLQFRCVWIRSALFNRGTVAGIGLPPLIQICHFTSHCSQDDRPFWTHTHSIPCTVWHIVPHIKLFKSSYKTFIPELTWAQCVTFTPALTVHESELNVETGV